MMNLDKKIVKFLQEKGGKVKIEDLLKEFDSYSKGYLMQRLYALNWSGYIIRTYSYVYLTIKGEEVKVE